MRKLCCWNSVRLNQNSWVQSLDPCPRPLEPMDTLAGGSSASSDDMASAQVLEQPPSLLCRRRTALCLQLTVATDFAA